ncbi:MAG: hypothetical protein E7048_03245 [Lentisphaerae bacterium]|nr:hypothetical protein [Lentisphaerota bacterium]
MKTPLILLNCLLAGGVCFAFVSNIKSLSKEEQVVPVKRERKQIRQDDGQQQTPAVVYTKDQQLQSILTANILNPERSPNTGAQGRNRRVQLSLVGTFKIGKSEGAIIRVRGAVNQNRFMQMGGGMFGMPGMGSPAQQGMQQNNTQQQSTEPRRNAGRSEGRGGMMSGTDNRMRFSSIFRQMSGEEEDADSATTGTKQYVKVGETLASGHTLVEVQRFKVILSRGGSKTELLLEDPSKNQVRRSSSRRMSAGQRFMQNSLNSQRQMMQMMQRMSWGMSRAMQNLNRSIQSGGGNGGRGGGRR